MSKRLENNGSGNMEAVRNLAKSFRAGVPLRAALDHAAGKYGSLAWDTAAAQDYLLSETVLYCPEVRGCMSWFTFGKARCRRFLRLVMGEIDCVRDAELDDNFAELAASFCQSESCSQEEFSYIVLELPTGKGRTGFRNFVARVSHRFNDLGHRVWEAGVFLCAQLADVGCDLRRSFEGGRILELGAGTGICAGAYVDAGVKYALLTDQEAKVVSNIEHNIGVNGCTRELVDNGVIETGVLDATDCEEVLKVAISKRIDIVVAADMTYDENLMLGVVKTFEVVVAENRIGLLAVTDRSESSTELLWRQVGERGVLKLERIRGENVVEAFDYLVGWDFSKVDVYYVKKIKN